MKYIKSRQRYQRDEMTDTERIEKLLNSQEHRDLMDRVERRNKASKKTSSTKSYMVGRDSKTGRPVYA